VYQGKPATDDINALRQQYRSTEFQRPALELADLDARHQQDLVQRQRTQESLTRQEPAVPIESQLRSIQDQMIPLTQNLRLVLQQEESIQRAIALRDLGDTRAVTAALTQLNQATALRLMTDATACGASDYAAGLSLGAAAAERSAAALAAGYKSLNDSALAMSQIGNMQQVNAGLANGLGAGGLGPSAGAPTGPSHLRRCSTSPARPKKRCSAR
jgi:hypothetical protein